MSPAEEIAQFKSRARAKVSKAIAEGLLARPAACEACGKAQWDVGTHRPKPGVIYHHHDYNQPLSVISLCLSCHQRVHSGKLPEPRTGRIYNDPRKKTGPRPEHERRFRVRRALGRGASHAPGVSRADFARISADLQREQLSA